MEKNFCSNCGAPLEHDSKFCGSCGARLEETVQRSLMVQNEAVAHIKQEFSTMTNNVEGTLSNVSSQDWKERIRDNSTLQSFKTNYLTIDGRLNRWAYFIKSLKLILMDFLAYLFILLCAGMMATDSAVGVLLGVVLMVPVFGFMLAVLVASVMLGVRRCHDLGHSGWLLLIGLVPVVNFFWALYLWFFPGTHGENQYGPDPLQVI